MGRETFSKVVLKGEPYLTPTEFTLQRHHLKVMENGKWRNTTATDS